MASFKRIRFFECD